MKASDLEDLAAMLDKNRTFERPEGQATGFSLEEHYDASPAEPSSRNTVVVSTDSQNAASPQPQASPAGISLPPTAVDHQLRLPQPSHGKEAERRKQHVHSARPYGDDIWTQDELKRVFLKQKGAGPTPAARAAMAQQAAMQGTAGRPNPATLWRPEAADAGLFTEPEHTILFQQSVSAEDVYLGVDFTRDASSASSDGVTVKIQLPKVASVSEIAMEVDEYELRVSVTGVYYLAAPLPRRVQRAPAEATWDAQKKLLTVRLKAEGVNGSDVKIIT